MSLKRLLLVGLATGLAISALTACGSDSGGEGAKASSSRSDESDAPTPSDEASVRRMLTRINEAWAQGDAAAYASFHTPDADLIDFRGVHAVGRQEIIDLLQPAFDGVLKDTRVKARIVDFRFLSATVAIFHTEGRIVPTGAESVQTFVATKDETDGWLIAAFQNTRKLDPTETD